MQSLAGSNFSGTSLKSMWISRLPATTQSVLTALTEDLPKLAAIADKIFDLPNHNSLSAVNSLNQPTPLEQQVAVLSKQMSELSHKIERRDRSRDRNDYRFRYRSQSREHNNRFKEAEKYRFILCKLI